MCTKARMNVHNITLRFTVFLMVISVALSGRRKYDRRPKFRPSPGGAKRVSCDGWIPEMPPLDGFQINDAFDFAKMVVNERKNLERQLRSNGEVLDSRVHSAEGRHQQPLSSTSELQPVQDMSETFMEASKFLKNRYDLSKEQVLCAMPRMPLQGKKARQIEQQCQAIHDRVQCPSQRKYRTQDGSCNNPRHKTWGRINTCFDRILPPEYEDGISDPRVSVTGGELPNPRRISMIVHRDLSNLASYTHMVMVFGQFISHDVNVAPHWVSVTREMIQCCPSSDHPQCLPIRIPRDDEFFSRFDFNCINFVRRAPCAKCSLGPRQPANGLTAFIDASAVYGTSNNVTRSLRAFQRGRLLSQNIQGVGELLPRSTEPETDQCSLPRENRFCFRAGDGRSNQHPALTMVHTTWLRQHNRIAEGLARVNPNWSDERLFQEARRIVAAQLQVVVYNEFLPIILGPKFLKRFELCQKKNGYTTYNPDQNPSVFMEFDTAAFRFGHSLIFGINGRPDAEEMLRNMQNLRDNFFFPFAFYEGAQTRLTQNFLFNSSQNFDRHITDDVRLHLYKVRGTPFGLDLTSINIQRGRDNGLASYTSYLREFFGEEIQTFEDLDNYMPADRWTILQDVYRSVHDIDLYTGGLCEYPVDGGVVGPTFAIIIGRQFHRLKYGDRYFYEHGGQPGSFTPRQLQNIRSTLLSKIICSNDANFPQIKKRAFLKDPQRSPTVPCQSLPDIDFRLWES